MSMLAVRTLALREIVHFSRARARMIGAFATPALFWLLVGSGFAGSTLQLGRSTAVGYSEYFFTGSLAMVMLFTSIFSAFSLIEDRNEGFLQAVLVSPVPTYQIALGKVAGGTLLASFQGLLFLVLAPMAGVPVQPLGYLLATLAIVACSFALSAVGLAAAWPATSVAGFHAVMNLLLMPMWLLSGALFPAAGAHPVMRLAMALNPFTYCVGTLRHALYYGNPNPVPGPDLATSLIGTVLFCLAAFAAAVAIARTKRQA
jgi:ABC-2 type transport system permease protein